MKVSLPYGRKAALSLDCKWATNPVSVSRAPTLPEGASPLSISLLHLIVTLAVWFLASGVSGSCAWMRVPHRAWRSISSQCLIHPAALDYTKNRASKTRSLFCFCNSWVAAVPCPENGRWTCQCTGGSFTGLPLPECFPLSLRLGFSGIFSLCSSGVNLKSLFANRVKYPIWGESGTVLAWIPHS